MNKQSFVYILTNRNNNVIYTGITSDLVKRVWQHKNRSIKGFSSKYNLSKLIYYEVYKDSYEAIKREKQVKGWLRIKKINLIKTKNKEFCDLYESIL